VDRECFNCKLPTSEDMYCSGCKSAICESCDINPDPPWGSHEPGEHLKSGYEEDL
jgi:hypothetical protein